MGPPSHVTNVLGTNSSEFVPPMASISRRLANSSLQRPLPSGMSLGWLILHVSTPVELPSTTCSVQRVNLCRFTSSTSKDPQRLGFPSLPQPRSRFSSQIDSHTLPQACARLRTTPGRRTSPAPPPHRPKAALAFVLDAGATPLGARSLFGLTT